MNDTELHNRMAATAHLAEAAHDWARIARDESLHEPIREQARAYAVAIRQEGNLKPC